VKHLLAGDPSLRLKNGCARDDADEEDQPVIRIQTESLPGTGRDAAEQGKPQNRIATHRSKCGKSLLQVPEAVRRHQRDQHLRAVVAGVHQEAGRD